MPTRLILDMPSLASDITNIASDLFPIGDDRNVGLATRIERGSWGVDPRASTAYRDPNTNPHFVWRRAPVLG
jgi:hypothetical protein